MATKKNKARRSRGLMGRSDIPFALRLQMQQQEAIVVNREHGAKMIMFCFSVALNEVKGDGVRPGKVLHAEG